MAFFHEFPIASYDFRSIEAKTQLTLSVGFATKCRLQHVTPPIQFVSNFIATKLL